jgi:hypothetical protein
VRRLTVIRWKTGETKHPRHREDILRCAHVLRLSPQERDELLLSAGHRPEELAKDVSSADPPVVEPQDLIATAPFDLPTYQYIREPSAYSNSTK